MVSCLPVTGDPPTECVPHLLCWVPGSSRQPRRSEPEPLSSWRPRPAGAGSLAGRERGRGGQAPAGEQSPERPREAWEQPGVRATRGRRENTRGAPLYRQLFLVSSNLQSTCPGRGSPQTPSPSRAARRVIIADASLAVAPWPPLGQWPKAETRMRMFVSSSLQSLSPMPLLSPGGPLFPT